MDQKYQEIILIYKKIKNKKIRKALKELSQREHNMNNQETNRKWYGGVTQEIQKNNKKR